MIDVCKECINLIDDIIIGLKNNRPVSIDYVEFRVDEINNLLNGRSFLFRKNSDFDGLYWFIQTLVSYYELYVFENDIDIFLLYKEHFEYEIELQKNCSKKKSNNSNIVRSGLDWGVLYSKEFTRNSFMVFCALKDRAFQIDKSCETPFECNADWLAKHLGFSYRYVRTALTSLERKNVISISGNMIKICWDTISEFNKKVKFYKIDYDNNLPF